MPAEINHTNNAICQRCGANFICMVHDIQNCFCRKIYLPKNKEKELSRTYTGCLCNNCLTALAKEPPCP